MAAIAKDSRNWSFYMMPRIPLPLIAVLIASLPFSAETSFAAPAADTTTTLLRVRKKEIQAEVASLLLQLDSDRYQTRRQAGKRLEELVNRPDLREVLAAEFHRILLNANTSREVRWRLEEWTAQLPKAPVEAVPVVSPEELAGLLRQVDDASQAIREGAAKRLGWLAIDPKWAEILLPAAKQALANPTLSTEACTTLDNICDKARAAWLQANPAATAGSAATDKQIAHWIGVLASSPVESRGYGPWPPHLAARQELMDILTRDAAVPRVKAAIDSRLKEKPDAATTERLADLDHLTRPAMVAECWQERRNTVQQYLLVNVPQQPGLAPRPSHFDRIDDQMAHCLSGSSLSLGDYPVGVAFPHPHFSTAFFQLVNLPTPARRMIYISQAERPEAVRLAEISRRTLDRFLAERHGLNEAEIVMLAQLDAKEVSRFAGRYFASLDDQRDVPRVAALQPGMVANGVLNMGSEAVPSPPQIQSSRHGLIAAQLAANGTKDAAPGLLEAIEKGKFLSPNAAQPYRLDWIAALTIAGRDPWPSVDAWLAASIGRTEGLIHGRTNGPESGATAAALLLKRHGQEARDFGLEPANDDVLASFGVAGHRFSSPEGRKRLEQWWRDQSQQARAAEADSGIR
jgi:hypothetical protein